MIKFERYYIDPERDHHGRALRIALFERKQQLLLGTPVYRFDLSVGWYRTALDRANNRFRPRLLWRLTTWAGWKDNLSVLNASLREVPLDRDTERWRQTMTAVEYAKTSPVIPRQPLTTFVGDTQRPERTPWDDEVELITRLRQKGVF